MFSNDVFLEFQADERNKQYADTVRHINNLKSSIKNDPKSEFKHLRQYYLARLQLKMKIIKYHNECGRMMTGAKESEFRSTKQFMAQLMKSEYKSKTD